MGDIKGDRTFDEIDTATLEKEGGKQKEPENDKNKDFFLLLLAAGTIISLVAWSVTHYMI